MALPMGGGAGWSAPPTSPYGSGRVGPVPGHQAGGPLSAFQPTVVGERGPEWFVPRSPGVVLPAGQSPTGGGGGLHIGELNWHEGRGEPKDLLAALDWLERTRPL